MPTYVAFLRAINLGARRKFPQADLRAAVESTGATDVQTYINTGNVRLTTAARSPRRVEETLEQAFAADRGFDVPTVVLRPAELVAVAADADRVAAQVGGAGNHYVTLLKEPPPADAVAALEDVDAEGERVFVVGRAVHLLAGHGLRQSRLASSAALTRLGVGTARDAKVIRTLAERWGR